VVAVARRRERLEALQQALVGQGVPIADFLPIVCDITKVLNPAAVHETICWSSGLAVLQPMHGSRRLHAC
jgi:short-subunit dehydrogenase